MKHARPDYDRIQDPAGKIPADEPVFLLRAQDATAPATVQYWAAANFATSPQLGELAYGHAQRMREWQAAHGKKAADGPHDAAPTSDPPTASGEVGGGVLKSKREGDLEAFIFQSIRMLAANRNNCVSWRDDPLVRDIVKQAEALLGRRLFG